jgi:uncharacterized membrane protein
MSVARSPVDPRRALVRIGISAAFGLAASFVAHGRLPEALAVLIGWDVASLVLLGVSWLTIASSDPSATQTRAGSEDPGRTLVYVIVVLTSAVSLLAANMLVPGARTMPTAMSRTVSAVCLGAVALAWAMTHTAFTFRYAHLYYREDAEGVGGVQFASDQGDEPPAYLDFAYFAFTIGMCFQVSDVCVTSHQIRRAVLLHAVISFVYNSAILAFVLSLVFSSANT